MNNKEALGKTWFVDIDGTIFEDKLNTEIDDMIQTYGDDSHLQEIPLKQAIEFFRDLPKRDKIIITTARESHMIPHTLRALAHFNMPYDDYIFDLARGPRVVVNDIKPAGSDVNKQDLDTAYAINVTRNSEDDIYNQYRFIESIYNNQINGTSPAQKLLEE